MVATPETSNEFMDQTAYLLVFSNPLNTIIPLVIYWMSFDAAQCKAVRLKKHPTMDIKCTPCWFGLVNYRTDYNSHFPALVEP